MKKKQDSHALAIAALAVRLEELGIRLAHAKLAQDADRIESLTRKLALATGRHARLKRKHQ